MMATSFILPLSLSSFSPLLPPSLLSSSHPPFFPCYESWLSSQPSPLAVIRGFGFQPACISRPGGFGKTSHLFQSNKELRVRVIQICEASKRTSCTQLLWWITKTKRNIKSKGKNGPPGWMKASTLPGAKKMSSLVVQQPGMDVIFLCSFSVFVHSITFPIINCPGVCRSNFFIFPHCDFTFTSLILWLCAVDKHLEASYHFVSFRHVLQKPGLSVCMFYYHHLHNTASVISLCSWPWLKEWRVC